MIGSVFFLAACSTSTPNDNENKSNEVTQANQVSSNTDSYYFTADEGGSITKISASSNKVVNTIAVEGAVHNVQVSPDGKVLGVTMIPSMGGHSGHNSSMKMNGYALFFDTTTDQLLKKVEVGNHPAHIVFSQDGTYVFVSNNEDNHVSVLDAKTFGVVQTIPTGDGPHGFRISSDSKYAYVANMGEDTVSVLNLSNRTEEKKIKVGKTPVTTAVSEDGNTLIVTLNTENSAVVVDLVANTTSKIPVGKGPAQIFIQPDNKYAFVANQGTEQNPSQSVIKIDLATNKVVATIQTGKGAHGIVTSNDNKFVYVTNMFDNTVTVIDNKNNRVIATVPVGKKPNGISFKPASK